LDRAAGKVVERLITLDKAALRHEGLPEETLQLTRDALKEHRALLAQLRSAFSERALPTAFKKLELNSYGII
jgi:hypothetical protein